MLDLTRNLDFISISYKINLNLVQIEFMSDQSKNSNKNSSQPKKNFVYDTKIVTKSDNSEIPKSPNSDPALVETDDQSLVKEIYSETPKSEKVHKKKGFSLGKFLSLVLILSSLFFLGAGAFAGYFIFTTADEVIVSDDDCRGLLDLKCLKIPNPLGSQRVKLKGEDEGRTNLLVIGLDNAASLSDTIILISYFYNEKKVVTLNIPRDTYITTSFANSSGNRVFFSEKINAVYSYASSANPGDPAAGANALSELISREFEVPIHYWAVTNFKAVQQVVNELGGIEVNVDIPFTDCQFPNLKNPNIYLRPCPSFQAGLQTMDGDQALIYARSRNAPQDPGDFARSRRQSVVIQSIAKKAKSKGIFGNLNNIRAYLKIFGENVKTNVKLDEMHSFYKLTEEINVDDAFLRIVWDNGNGILCDGPQSSGRGYHLLYCGGQIVGSNGNSPAKQRARRAVQNMLIESQSSELYQSQVVYLGNQSDDTFKARNTLVDMGFESQIFNNSYSPIAPATATSVEKITIYIPDQKLRELFAKLSPKPDFDYELQAELPSDKTLPSNASGAKIIVWVESIK